MERFASSSMLTWSLFQCTLLWKNSIQQNSSPTFKPHFVHQVINLSTHWLTLCLLKGECHVSYKVLAHWQRCSYMFSYPTSDHANGKVACLASYLKYGQQKNGTKPGPYSGVKSKTAIFTDNPMMSNQKVANESRRNRFVCSGLSDLTAALS